jgi:hypothetical protein
LQKLFLLVETRKRGRIIKMSLKIRCANCDHIIKVIQGEEGFGLTVCEDCINRTYQMGDMI